MDQHQDVYITNLYRGPRGVETRPLDRTHCTMETVLCHAIGYSVATLRVYKLRLLYIMTVP